MPASRALVLTAAVVLLAGCGPNDDPGTAADLPLVTTTTSAARSTAPRTTAPVIRLTATPRATASPSATAGKTPSPTPTVGRTTARPVQTTARPTPRPTTPRPVTTTKPPATGTAQLAISGFNFVPQNLDVKRGTTVRVANHDSAGHSWTSVSGIWDSGTLPQNASFSYRFMSVGVFEFQCNPHEFMTHGRITVT
jgi:plastocyanin